ncbi:MAG: hypothetical protein AAFU71_12035 [Cyanobacteria bacterium J06632_22]
MSLVLHDNTPREPVKDVNMHAFVVSFSRDPKYIAIRIATQNQIAANRLETFLIAEQEEWETIVALWNAMISAVPNFEPSTEDIQRWNGLMNQNNIPLVFNPDESLSYKNQETYSESGFKR